MEQAPPTSPHKVKYSKARLILLAIGLGILFLIAGIQQLRSVEPVEQAAILLFIPVFVGFVFWKVPGGVVMALLASGAYALLRLPSIQVVGAADFLPVILSRSAAYLAFGLLGGWATYRLEGSLTKLELYDQIDDETGLYNARFFLQDTDLEISRSTRYRTIFSVVVVDVSMSELDALGQRQRKAVVRELGRVLRNSIRNVDRAIHAASPGAHHFGVLLPETAQEGASIFGERLLGSVRDFLKARGVESEKGVTLRVATFPGDEEKVADMRSDFAQIDRAEHPGEQVRAQAR